jgi:hypothetical protein
MRRLLFARPSSECRDGFDDRTSDNGMGRAPSGQVWQVLYQSPQPGAGTSGGRAYQSAAIQPFTLVECGRADGSVQATLAATGAASAMQLYARVTPAANMNNQCHGIYVNVAATGYAITRRVGSVVTGLGTYSTTPAAGDVLRLSCRGPNLELFVNGVSRVTAVDGWSMGGTLWGFRMQNDTAGRWDDFAATRV